MMIGRSKRNSQFAFNSSVIIVVTAAGQKIGVVQDHLFRDLGLDRR